MGHWTWLLVILTASAVHKTDNVYLKISESGILQMPSVKQTEVSWVERLSERSALCCGETNTSSKDFYGSSKARRRGVLLPTLFLVAGCRGQGLEVGEPVENDGQSS